MDGQTYKERVNRWRIVRHDELPEAHKAEYRLMGIDPDDNWSLIWSFETEEAAKKMLADCNADKASWQTYKLVDGGKAIEIEKERLVMAKEKYRELTAEELAALRVFATENGRKWKDELANKYWFNARVYRANDGREYPVLHRLRNDLGPSWLYGYKLKKEEA